jgi:hypothetical protein
MDNSFITPGKLSSRLVALEYGRYVTSLGRHGGLGAHWRPIAFLVMVWGLGSS